MKVGFLGLGKLGLPVALAVESKGHYVCGTDISKSTIDSIKNKKIAYKEIWVDDYLKKTNLEIFDVKVKSYPDLVPSEFMDVNNISPAPSLTP